MEVVHRYFQGFCRLKQNTCEGRSLSFDKFANDHKHKLLCRAEHFEEALRKQKIHRSRTLSLHCKFQRYQMRKRYIIDDVDQNNGQKRFLSSKT